MASASGAWRSPSALDETAFSQVRTDPVVLAAWIERPGEEPLSFPPELAVPVAPLRTIQLAPLGPCSVALTTIDHAGTRAEVVLVALDHDGLRTMLALARTP